MRTRPRLRSALLFDIAMGVAFLLVAVAFFLAEGRPSAIVATAHSVASRIGWRESYETGLLIGLGVVMVAVVAAGAVAMALRRRARPAAEAR